MSTSLTCPLYILTHLFNVVTWTVSILSRISMVEERTGLVLDVSGNFTLHKILIVTLRKIFLRCEDILTSQVRISWRYTPLWSMATSSESADCRRKVGRQHCCHRPPCQPVRWQRPTMIWTRPPTATHTTTRAPWCTPTQPPWVSQPQRWLTRPHTSMSTITTRRICTLTPRQPSQWTTQKVQQRTVAKKIRRQAWRM